jgi:hypothetical protein
MSAWDALSVRLDQRPNMNFVCTASSSAQLSEDCIMAEPRTTTVCIVGAGSMGIATGYHLAQAGAAITFLVRPHHRDRLSTPQTLYSFDDQSLKTLSNYGLMTDPGALAGTPFDFVVITLDGKALRAEAGQKLVEAIGRAFEGTSTAVVLGSVGIDLRSWFLEQSGLAETQVTSGMLANLTYEVGPAALPVHPGVNADLLATADYGFRHFSPFGFSVDLSAPRVAHDFANLYNASGASQCAVVPAADQALSMALFPVLMAWELLDWPAIADIDACDETWQLGADAMGEFQRLSIFGAGGQAASQQTTSKTLLEFFGSIEQACYPFDFAAFNRYHHGAKVNSQDHQILDEALSLGEAEGADMPALRKLIALLHREQSSA